MDRLARRLHPNNRDDRPKRHLFSENLSGAKRMNDSKRLKLDHLIANFDTAMLVTFSLDGAPRARPMAIAGSGEQGELYFTTRSEDEKLQEILQSPNVAVTMQAPGQYISLSGEARIETDLLLAESLWSPAMRVWFPEGFRSDSFTVIHFDPRYAEYWDRTGIRKIEYLWEAGKAIASGRKSDDTGLSGHDKLHLGGRRERD
jgi:general stress protein 26